MPNVLTEGRHTGEFLLSEGEGSISRDAVKLAAGTAGLVKDGTVLGQVTGASNFVPLAAPNVPATGSIAFTANPAADTTVTLNGNAITFKASGATGNQVNIGADLAATLASLQALINGSADAQITKFAATVSGVTLKLAAETAGAGGNALTIATTVAGATVSGGTLAGGASGASDGSQIPAAILLGNAFRSASADVDIVVISRFAEVKKPCLSLPAGVSSDAAKATVYAGLDSLGIIAR